MVIVKHREDKTALVQCVRANSCYWNGIDDLVVEMRNNHTGEMPVRQKNYDKRRN
jgi:hypothetical protein